MVARTAAGMVKTPRDGSDDPAYQTELREWAFEGQRACLIIVIVTGVLGLLLSRVAHWAAFKAFEDLAQMVNYWITFPAFGVIFWGGEILYILRKGRLWINVAENHSQIVIDVWPGRPNRMIKLPGGFWLIPFWWLVLPRNLTNHEDQTVTLLPHEYPAHNGEGGAVVEGSFTYFVPFEEAKGYIAQDKSVIDRRLVDHVKGEIGPSVAKHDVTKLAGQSSMVTKEITATFLGAGVNETEADCHVRIREVTISQVALDPKTRGELEKNQAAKALAARMKDQLAVIEEGGVTIDDPVKRYDRIKLAGLDPGRTIADTNTKTTTRHEADENMVEVAKGLGVGLAQGLAMLAKITGDLSELKGEKPKGKKGGK